jgi:hypothetical protein
MVIVHRHLIVIVKRSCVAGVRSYLVLAMFEEEAVSMLRPTTGARAPPERS